jgi:hypothetical protein
MRQKTNGGNPEARARGDLGVAAAAVLACGQIAAAAVLACGVMFERARSHRAWLAAIPIIAVNFVAFFGQLSFFQANRVIEVSAQPVTIPLAVAVIVALALESIAVYLAWQAHIARKAHDSALRLRLAAYLVALVIGAVNYSHFCAPHWRPTAFAVVFALASVISPALWGVHSNRESRDDLKAQDLIEDHGVRLGLTRWFWHPWRSLMVQSLAAWAGENRPAAAIALYETRRAARQGRKGREEQDAEAAGAASVRKPGRPEASQPAVLASQAPLPAPERGPRPDRARAARTGLAAARSDTERRLVRELIATGPELWPSQHALANRSFGGSRTTARRVIKLARDELALNGAALNGNGGGHHVRANGS